MKFLRRRSVSEIQRLENRIKALEQKVNALQFYIEHNRESSKQLNLETKDYDTVLEHFEHVNQMLKGIY